MGFAEALDIVKEALAAIGSDISGNKYDGLLVKRLEASNTLDEGRTTNQTHIAITGKQMDMFPYVRADGYFEVPYDQKDQKLKKFFIAQIPVYLHNENVAYLDSSADLFADQSHLVHVSIVRSRRNGSEDQIQMCMVNVDSPEYISYRKLVHSKSYMILLKRDRQLVYDLYCVKESDAGSNLVSLNNDFVTQETSTVVKIDRVAEGEKEFVASNPFNLSSLPDTFDSTFARRYITALLAKPFVILTGNSGTGKTRIAKQFAEYLAAGEDNWLIVPVGADWTDNTKVLGYYNPLAEEGIGKYEKTKIVELIERANANPEIPYFLILDEMNLSHVERYFSDFLSHMEIPDNPFELDGYKENNGRLTYPKNLFVTGTVNIDETTYMFSPKVLDRANVVEFKPEMEAVLGLLDDNTAQVPNVTAPQGTAESFYRLAKAIREGKYELDHEQLLKVRDVLASIYKITEKHGYEFAYRTVKEIKQYLIAAHMLSGSWDDAELYRALDEQLLQKILPKIHGNRKEIGGMLEELSALCNAEGKELQLSEAKIEQMNVKLSNVQYASFI